MKAVFYVVMCDPVPYIILTGPWQISGNREITSRITSRPATLNFSFTHGRIKQQ
jgi:hypothetical protein